MNAVLSYGVIIIPIWLLLFAALVALQIFLSRAKSRVPGLVIPIFYFTTSLLVVTLVVVGMKSPQDSSNIFGMILLAILGGLVPANIPTAIHLLIYFLIRKNMNYGESQEIKKMTIQDLE